MSEPLLVGVVEFFVARPTPSWSGEVVARTTPSWSGEFVVGPTPSWSGEVDARPTPSWSGEVVEAMEAVGPRLDLSWGGSLEQSDGGGGRKVAALPSQ